MNARVISELSTEKQTVEVVERKGLGHPDTICDALAENLSRDLSREYRERPAGRPSRWSRSPSKAQSAGSARAFMHWTSNARSEPIQS
jgi:hypothetical protein